MTAYRDLAPGSEEWCQRTIDLARIRWQRARTVLAALDETLGEVIRHRVWERVPPEKPYGSLEALLGAELGITAAEADALLRAYEQRHNVEEKAGR